MGFFFILLFFNHPSPRQNMNRSQRRLLVNECYLTFGENRRLDLCLSSCWPVLVGMSIRSQVGETLQIFSPCAATPVKDACTKSASLTKWLAPDDIGPNALEARQHERMTDGGQLKNV